MWLINTETLQLEEFYEAEAPPYAILSHTWEKDEVTFQEFRSGQNINKAGHQKIKGCCLQATNDGYQYAWVDTCCIDKTSSAELSEAINSMHQWYSNADICYAYLWDVPTLFSVQDPCWGASFDVKKNFRRSKWFSRGWTLQELLAPPIVEFFAKDWSSIGLRSSLKEHLAQITGINIGALEGVELSTFNVAERMSWAAYRETTRIEDKAYCLLGIFGVHMPLLYGEGKQAFIRLQEEILKTSEDYTMFSWSAGAGAAPLVAPDGLPAQVGLLADDPVRFRVGFGTARYSNVVPIPRIFLRRPGASPIPSLEGLDSDDSPPSLTGRGLRICLPLSEVPGAPDLYYACLRCRLANPEELANPDEYLCVVLKNTTKFQVFEKVLSKTGQIPTVSKRRLSHEFKLYTVYIEQQLQKRPALKSKLDCRIISHANHLHREGLELLNIREYVEAEELLERALSIKKRILPQDDQETMYILFALVRAYAYLEKHEKHAIMQAELWEMQKRDKTTWTSIGNAGTLSVFSPD